MSSEKQSLELLKLHSDEVHFQIRLNWDRARAMLTFQVALLALVAGLRGLREGYYFGALIIVGFVGLAAAGIIQTGHTYYRSARDQRRKVEKHLGVELGFVTTPGMTRFETFGKWFPSVKNLLIVLNVAIALVSFGLAFGVFWPL